MATDTPLGFKYWKRNVSKNLTGFSFLISFETPEKAILYARYNKNNVPRYLIVIWIIGNNLKILIKPIVKKITNEVNPSVTPRIWGMVLVIPKLNPE